MRSSRPTKREGPLAQARRGRLRLRRPGRAVRLDDQPLAHLPEHGPHQRVEPLLRVHVPRRLGLQPLEPEPHQVPPGGRQPSTAEGYRHAIRVFFVAQEILVDFSAYPTRAIAKNSHDYRPLGLGYANLGTLLMLLGIPYDSDTGRSVAGALTAILCGHAYKVSAEMAKAKGPFAGYTKNREPMFTRDAHAPGGGLRHQPRQLPRSRSGAPPARTGTTSCDSAGSTATATRSRRCLRPRARLAS